MIKISARILFITSRFFLQPTLDALKKLDPACESLVLPYDNFQHISQVYQENIGSFDACFVSGIGAKTAIEQACPDITKPLVHFQTSPNALHRDILRLAVKNQSLDFSRIVMDFLFPLDTGYTVSDYLAIEDLSLVDRKTRECICTHAWDVEEFILAQIRKLWEANAIDLVICQYSSIQPALAAMGIPVHCPYLQDRSLDALIQEVLLKLELSRLHDNHPAIIQVFPRHLSSMTKAQQQQLSWNMKNFLKPHMLEAVLQVNATCCTLITSLRVLRFLTREFQVCHIAAFLEDKLDFPVCVGYGIGTTATHAMNNVQIASREAKLKGKSFVVDTNGSFIGPLSSEKRMVLSVNAMPDVSDIAKQCNLSVMTIQKVMTSLQNIGSDKITTQELASRMDTTIRNANRIMQNLCRGGIAVPVYTQSSHSRGRPIQVYALNFRVPKL